MVPAGDQVVVEQRATWDVPGAAQPGEPQVVATVFLVRDGRVRRVIRYVNLDAALAAVGLNMADEVREAGA